MQAYLDLMRYVSRHGVSRSDRTAVGTLSVFGYQLRFPLHVGFPLLTTKKLHVKSIVHELLWFLRGETNINYLKKHDINIWNAWANADGDLGPVYGAQWRRWKSADGTLIDQISRLVDDIKNHPDSRRLLVSTWNVGELPYMALAPCHVFFQCYVAEGKLSCHLYQRSADIFLGLPFNIASYALLVSMLAQVTQLIPGELIISLGDAHLYRNHLAQANLQLTRDCYPLPTIKLNPEVTDLLEFRYEDFSVVDYRAHPHIKAPIAV